MIDFRESEEKKLSNQFKKKGYLILKADDINALNYLRLAIIKILKKLQVLI